VDSQLTTRNHQNTNPSLYFLIPLLLLPVTTILSLWLPWLTTRQGDVSLRFNLFLLPEFIRLLPTVRTGQVAFHRIWLIAPTIAMILTMSFAAWHALTDTPYRFWRYTLWIIAGSQLYPLLPPTWTPMTLFAPGNRPLTGWLSVTALLWLTVPYWSRHLSWPALAILNGVALLFAFGQFFRVMPALQQLYAHSFRVGWGPFWLAFTWLIVIFLSLQPRDRSGLTRSPGRRAKNPDYAKERGEHG